MHFRFLFPGALLSATLATTPCRAVERLSADYAVNPETVNAGGRRVMSGDYRMDASIGEIGGLGSASGTVAKTGYAGQLYDVRSVLVSATPAEVNEGGMRALFATALLDDSTTLALAPGTVAWSIVTGPIASISPGGVVIAQTVAATTPGTVRGTFGGKSGDLTLDVLNIGNDNYGVYAGDGVSDTWQVQYFGPDNPLGAGDRDADGDGNLNVLEFAAGTDPTLRSSFFAFRVESVPGQPHQFRLVFSPRLNDRTYTILSSPTLGSESWSVLTGAPASDVGLERVVTDPNTAGARRKFYRVEITAP